MKQHWKILLWMLGGVLVGGALRTFFEAPASSGLSVKPAQNSVIVTKSTATAIKSKIFVGDRIWAAISGRGRSDSQERRKELHNQKDLTDFVKTLAVGDAIFFEVGEDAQKAKDHPRPLALGMHPDAPRKAWRSPFAFLADIFMALLKMLIVPLVLTSIITGIAGVGATKDLKRLGLKTFAYYVTTSLIAIVIGLTLVNIIRPGIDAELGLPIADFGSGEQENFLEVLKRMVPVNFFQSLGENGAMLQIIFFALFFGLCITIAPDIHRERMKSFFDSAFEIMMRMAGLVLKLIPYGVFCLLAKIVGETGFGLFKPLGLYMIMIASGLILHAFVVLPLILKFVAGISPIAWLKCMGPALMTAFSASSSSMTLPVTLRCVEKRGKVSNKISSFVLPLGATINMDGTALYECAGVIFLAQYYSSVGAIDPLTLSQQLLIVFMALLASIGAAGIPSAGLVMMLTILSALKLPLEGAALLLAVDRPLDMMRTAVNVWSDSCGAVVIASSEKEDFRHLKSGGVGPEG